MLKKTIGNLIKRINGGSSTTVSETATGISNGIFYNPTTASVTAQGLYASNYPILGGPGTQPNWGQYGTAVDLGKVDPVREEKRRILSDLQVAHLRRVEEAAQNDPNVKDIRRQMEENDIAILKLINKNEILRGARKSFEDEAKEKYEQEHPHDDSELKKMNEEDYPSPYPLNSGYVPYSGTTTTGTNLVMKYGTNVIGTITSVGTTTTTI